MTFPGRGAVSNSSELKRILALPRRTVDGTSLVQPLTDALKTPHGTWTLKPLQAQSLYDMGVYGGLFGPLRVGSGKTLITLLSPVLLEAKRPVLLLPASLIQKTERERRELARHWRIPTSIRLISYEMLGRVQAANTLDFYRPDLIILDESHKVKSKKAGVTRRLIRYFREHPETKCVAVSGTVMKNSIKDFAHISRWCLKEGNPLPKTEEELDVWASAIDDKVQMFQRADPGALTAFSGGNSDLGAVRQGFQKRLLETPGIVGSTGDQVACSLYLEGHVYPVKPETEKHFHNLRDKWETPTGWQFSEAVELWRHARELALGFHYEWVVPGPRDWLEARKEWASLVREVLSHSRTLDTELHVALAIDAGTLKTGKEELTRWRDIRDTFTPETKAVWHDPSALEWVANRAGKEKTIVWTEHTWWGRALSKVTGWPYFGAQGVDGTGKSIESCSGKTTCVASVAANGTGRNLQSWSHNLITSCPTTAPMWEQLIGRTWRTGQVADQVNIDLMLGCWEHVNGFRVARDGALAQADMLGQSQALLLADISMPPIPVTGDRWLATPSKSG